MTVNMKIMAATLSTALVLGACGSESATTAADTGTPNVTTETTTVTLDTRPRFAPVATRRSAAVAVAAVLSVEEQEALVYLREEEKLAHDLYVAFYDEWGLRIFDNIAASEVNHYTEVATIIDRYDVADPSADYPVGEFLLPEIQGFYDDLVARGLTSPTEALMVGAYFEEFDILDLMALESDYADIESVYANLLAGSKNHLRAFVRQLAASGINYEPVVMSDELFDAIIGDPTEPARAASWNSGGNASGSVSGVNGGGNGGGRRNGR